MVSTINKRIFYQYIPGGSLFPSLQSEQINGLGYILDHWNHRPKGLSSLLSQEGDSIGSETIDKSKLEDATLAYLLATIYHETHRTMQPLRAGDGPNVHISERWREVHLSDYYPYYGRGFIPLTWRSHYHKATQFLRQLYLD